MGRWQWDKKTAVEDCHGLWSSSFHKWGVFKPTVSYASGGVQWKNGLDEVTASVGYVFSQQPSPRLTLSYTLTRAATQEKQDLNYFIELVAIPCRFGGLRYWFICPLVINGRPCRRRVAKLYLPPGGTYFGCRHCYKLTYRSAQEHDARVDRLRRNPMLLYEHLNNPDPHKSLLALKAWSFDKRRRTL